MAKDDLTLWISQLQRGDEGAAHRIWDACFPQLLKMTRVRMRSLPRRSVDEEDVALSALNSFMRGVQEGRFRPADRGDLWKLLSTIALRKVVAEQRRTFADKRGRGRVRGESVFGPAQDHSECTIGLAHVLIDENQLPELSEDVARLCEDLLSQLNDDKLQQTAIMKMEGYTHQEISERLGCSVSRTKQRLARIREKWQHESCGGP